MQDRFPVAVAAVRFLLYTGARKSEALGLRWEHVHGDRAVLPDSKTGPRTIWLASPARAILDTLANRDGCPWVFALPRGNPISLWHPLAGDPHKGGASGACAFTIFATTMPRSRSATARVCASLPALLGHADIEITFGYAHLAEGAVFGAANRVSRTLADALDRESTTDG